jgi:hypothetical protein
MADVLHLYPAGQSLETRVVRKGDWIPETVIIAPEASYLEMGEEDIV